MNLSEFVTQVHLLLGNYAKVRLCILNEVLNIQVNWIPNPYEPLCETYIFKKEDGYYPSDDFMFNSVLTSLKSTLRIIRR